MITNQFIIEYLKDYYKRENKLPLSTENHPFSKNTVSNRFKGWNNALKLAGIPCYKNDKQKVNCKECNKEFYKQLCQIKKSKQNFCSRSCSAIFHNKIIDRTLSEESKNKIREKLQKSHNCIVCNEIIKGGRRKTCSDNCLKIFYNKTSIERGKKGGKASAASQQRRSKNEIACAELCIQHFGENDILCNQQIFRDKNGNTWDCDIYIKSLKIAILWDGYYYHYSNSVSKKQKARDKLKRKIIVDNDCEYYTIIDKGKFNKKFVQEQFNLFLHRLNLKNVLNEFMKSIA
jgi:hypothetical protein